MKFKRGIDPKDALGIGIEVEINRLIDIQINEHRFNILNTYFQHLALKKLRYQIGRPINIKVLADVEAQDEDVLWMLEFHIILEERALMIYKTLHND